MPATQCLQSLHNGQQCNAPAVNGTLFCRHHDPQHELDQERRRKERAKEPFFLPPFSDDAGVLDCVTAVLNGLSDRVIKRPEADTFLQGLKFAVRLMEKLDQAARTSRPVSIESENFYQQPPLYQEELIETPEPGTPDQLRDQTLPRRAVRNMAGNTEPQPITRRPSDQALARLAASGNQKAADFLDRLHQSRQEAHPSTDDQFVKELIAKSPKRDTRFTRA